MEILLEENKHKKAKHQDVEETEVISDIRETASADLKVAAPLKVGAGDKEGHI